MLSDFYRSSQWKKLTQMIKLSRVDNNGFWICEHCKKPIVKSYDCICHHKIYLTEENYTDPDIALNENNIALLHHRCHNRVHNKLGQPTRQVYIVYGSPLSGKSRYVNDVMLSGDLLLDIDRLWEAISNQPRYIKPKEITSNVFAIRDLILQQIKHRQGKWQNAYVVGGYPLSVERTRLANMLGARLIHIDTNKETCIDRLLNCEDKRDKEQWKKFINEWWEKYSATF